MNRLYSSHSAQHNEPTQRGCPESQCAMFTAVIARSLQQCSMAGRRSPRFIASDRTEIGLADDIGGFNIDVCHYGLENGCV